MTPRSILAVTDFSQAGDHALARAAQLSVQHGAQLKLLCVAYPGEPLPPDAVSRLELHALQLGLRHDLDVRYESRIAFSPQDVAASAAWADLLVWGTAPLSGMRAFLMGQPVQAVLRHCARPVLVVRRPARRPYASLIVAVDFSEASQSLVELGFNLNPGAQVELLHAINTANERKLRNAEATEQAVAAYREQCLHRARVRMSRLTGACDALPDRVISSIHHGSPARQVLDRQERSGAELIVVGRYPASAASDFMFASTAQRVLRESSADVLVAPHARQGRRSADAAATRSVPQPLGVRRLRAGPPQPPSLPNPAAMPAKPESI